jgi:hypothetical protein
MKHALSLPRAAATMLVLLLATACGGDEAEEQSGADNAAAVDPKSAAAPTEAERAAFTAPADSILTPAQVEAFLRTTLVQFDLVRAEAPQYHARAAEMEKRGEKGGLIAGLRNAADAGRFLAGFTDLVGGSYVRSARSLGVNPAEMEWVRERMSDVSAAMAVRPLHQAAVRQAREIREQAAGYRGQPGFDEATIQQMLQTADAMEKAADEQGTVGRAVERNREVLRRARPHVSDPMWTAVAVVGGTGGLAALTGLGDPADSTAVRQMDEWRRIYTDALADQVTPGLEADAPADEDASGTH